MDPSWVLLRDGEWVHGDRFSTQRLGNGGGGCITCRSVKVHFTTQKKERKILEWNEKRAQGIKGRWNPTQLNVGIVSQSQYKEFPY